MEIKEPKFNVGDKVIDKSGYVGTVIKVESYHLDEEEYWYDVNCDEGTTCLFKESYLEPYVEKPSSVWDLKEDDEYFLIFGDGNVSESTWCDCTNEKKFRKLGNVFLNKEEAEYEVERRKIETEMLRLGGRREFKKGETNYYIFCDFNTGYIDSDYDVYDICSQGTIYFDSIKEVQNVIEQIGKKRIKKYIFGVDE